MSYLPAIIDSRDTARRAYAENLDYDLGGGSLEKCRVFVMACRFLLGSPVTRSEQSGGGSIELDPVRIEEQQNTAVRWYRNNYGRLSGGSGSTQFADFSNFRD